VAPQLARGRGTKVSSTVTIQVGAHEKQNGLSRITQWQLD
jgi:hypothetical protein